MKTQTIPGLQTVIVRAEIDMRTNSVYWRHTDIMPFALSCVAIAAMPKGFKIAVNFGVN